MAWSSARSSRRRATGGKSKSVHHRNCIKADPLSCATTCSGMTLQPQPPTPSPSWRVLIALRLLHLPLPARPNAIALEASLRPWRALVAGMSDLISLRNEADVRQTLRTLCDRVVVDAESGLEACEDLRDKWAKEGDVEDGLKEGLRMVMGVWREERSGAQAVARELVEP